MCYIRTYYTLKNTLCKGNQHNPCTITHELIITTIYM